MDKIIRGWQTSYREKEGMYEKFDEIVEWINDTEKALKKLKNWMIKHG